MTGPLLAATLLLTACASQSETKATSVTAPTVPPESADEPARADEPAPSSVAGTDSAEPASSEAGASAEPAPAVAEPSSASQALPELPKGTLVLHVGDSFAASLGVPLGKRFKAAGVRYILEFQTASYVPTWAFGDELPKYIARYNPDFVMVTLGANEIEIVNPEQRAGAVKRLIKHLGGRPCVWVAPPLWKPDTGFMKVIRENSAPCRYLDSTALVGDLPRQRDKIHPNEEGRERWAELVLGWLAQERAPTPERAWALKLDP